MNYAKIFHAVLGRGENVRIMFHRQNTHLGGTDIMYFVLSPLGFRIKVGEPMLVFQGESGIYNKVLSENEWEPTDITSITALMATIKSAISFFKDNIGVTSKNRVFSRVYSASYNYP